MHRRTGRLQETLRAEVFPVPHQPTDRVGTRRLDRRAGPRIHGRAGQGECLVPAPHRHFTTVHAGVAYGDGFIDRDGGQAGDLGGRTPAGDPETAGAAVASPRRSDARGGRRPGSAPATPDLRRIDPRSRLQRPPRPPGSGHRLAVASRRRADRCHRRDGQVARSRMGLASRRVRRLESLVVPRVVRHRSGSLSASDRWRAWRAVCSRDFGGPDRDAEDLGEFGHGRPSRWCRARISRCSKREASERHVELIGVGRRPRYRQARPPGPRGSRGTRRRSASGASCAPH